MTTLLLIIVLVGSWFPPATAAAARVVDKRLALHSRYKARHLRARLWDDTDAYARFLESEGDWDVGVGLWEEMAEPLKAASPMDWPVPEGSPATVATSTRKISLKHKPKGTPFTASASKEQILTEFADGTFLLMEASRVKGTPFCDHFVVYQVYQLGLAPSSDDRSEELRAEGWVFVEYTDSAGRFTPRSKIEQGTVRARRWRFLTLCWAQMFVPADPGHKLSCIRLLLSSKVEECTGHLESFTRFVESTLAQISPAEAALKTRSSGSPVAEGPTSLKSDSGAPAAEAKARQRRRAAVWRRALCLGVAALVATATQWAVSLGKLPG